MCPYYIQILFHLQGLAGFHFQFFKLFYYIICNEQFNSLVAMNLFAITNIDEIIPTILVRWLTPNYWYHPCGCCIACPNVKYLKT